MSVSLQNSHSSKEIFQYVRYLNIFRLLYFILAYSKTIVQLLAITTASIFNLRIFVWMFSKTLNLDCVVSLPPCSYDTRPPVVMSTPYLSIFSPNTGKCGKNVDQNNSEYGYFLRSENLANSELPRGNPPSKLFWLTNSWVDKYSVPSSPQNFNLKNWCDPDKTLPTRVYCEIQKLTRDSQWLDIFPGWTKLFHIVWEV